ncbi:MAG: hypothetical protein ACJA1A_001389 [Saprospiraceae bacterium]|jgi:hypothetical protein
MDYWQSTSKLFILACLISTNISAQTNNTFFLGHSLINFDVPNMVDKLSIASNQAFAYDANIGNGATLDWHWGNPTTGQGGQWDLTLPQGGYENFILTEAVPLENHLQFSNTYRITDSLCSFANQYNPNIQYYIYKTWHCTNSGNGTTSGAGGYPCSWDPNSNTPWRDRINIDLPRWESIADSINLNHENPMLVIPGGQALGRLSDTIQSGAVSGLSSVFDLFDDEYHLDSRGNYFIACVMYSVIHGMSPVGLPNQLTNQFGNPYTIYPTTEQASIMQEIAWQTVCKYQRSGVECETVALYPISKESPNIKIYPVPANDFISIEYDALSAFVPFTIYDQLGKIILSGSLSSKTSVVNVAELSAGMYFLSTKNKTLRFIK